MYKIALFLIVSSFTHTQHFLNKYLTVSVVDNRRVVIKNDGYRYDPYGVIVDRSSGRPVMVPVFTIIRFNRNFCGKSVDKTNDK